MVLLYSPLPVWRKVPEPGELLQPKPAEKPPIPLDEAVQEESAPREVTTAYRQAQQDYQLERRTFL
jgi:hypothetical protein